MAYTYTWTEEPNFVGVSVTLEHGKFIEFKFIKSEDAEIDANIVMNEIRKCLPCSVCEKLKRA